MAKRMTVQPSTTPFAAAVDVLQVAANRLPRHLLLSTSRLERIR